jgi:hypothetical protein
MLIANTVNACYQEQYTNGRKSITVVKMWLLFFGEVGGPQSLSFKNGTIVTLPTDRHKPYL